MVTTPHAFFVQQDADYQLYAATVWEELLLGLDNTQMIQEQSKKYMETLQLSEFRDRHPGSLSGGQKQRVLLAAAALRQERLLVLDEPTSGLDGQNMKRTAKLLKELANGGTAIVVITHDMELIESCATRICHIADGKVTYNCTLKSNKEGGHSEANPIT